jgi:hypothetical protein
MSFSLPPRIRNFKAFVFFITAVLLALGLVAVSKAITPHALAINCGGEAFRDSRGVEWQADQYFLGGEVYRSTHEIADTLDATIYQTQRYGNFSYSLPLKNGNYYVLLHFSEVYVLTARRRQFRVVAEGKTVVNGLDVLAEVGGPNLPFIKRVVVTVSDGNLDLSFVSQVDNAFVSGIEVVEASEKVPPFTQVENTKPSRPLSVKSAGIPFSSRLTPYPIHPSARKLSADQILHKTETPDVELGFRDQAVRMAVVKMYKNYGIDISLDETSLLSMRPTSWASNTPQPLSGTFRQPYSIDASFYHPIPGNSPRVALPSAYINSFQINAVYGGDGIGIGIAVSSSSDPRRRIRSEWYGNPATLKDYYMPVRGNALSFQGYNKNSDAHLSFIDSSSLTFLNGYKVSLDTDGVNYLSLFAAGVYPLGTLGDIGGSVASGFSEIGPLVRPGEISNPNAPIPHAVGGPVSRVWKARVYPAHSWDSFIDAANPCNGNTPANTGLVPYGGVIQLDPALSFTQVGNKYQTTVGGQKISLSLPAFRILEAMQHYGYYVMDFGCADLDVYTNISQTDVDPYGGFYGNGNGPGIQNEIQSVLTKATLYVVPPIVKR